MNADLFDLHEKLHQLMWMSRQYMHKNHMERGPMADPSRGQGRVLAALKMQPEISTRDLAYLLGIRTQSLNELLAKLEKNECITRVQSESDKRIILVRITDKGRNEEQQESDFSNILNCLNEEEQTQLGDFLDRIIAALEAKIGEESEDEQLEWMNAAKERFGENFEALLEMRRGGMPFRRGFGGFPPDRRFGGMPHRGRRGPHPSANNEPE